jgi:hypothetical protein
VDNSKRAGGHHIRAHYLVERHKITQVLSEIITSARYLGSIERATVSASVTVLGRLAQALDVDACELIRTPARR